MTRPIAFLAFLIAGSVQAQILDITPAFPTQDDTVNIIYDATEGNGALVGVSPVYAHAGLITTASTSPTDWKHVQGNWGQADPNVLMTSLGNNKHQISYHLPTYHGFNTSTTTVQQMAFVFRNANGSVVGRAADGADIYYPVYPSNAGLLTAFFKPTDQLLVNMGDTIGFKVASNQDATLSVYDNGQLIQSDSATKQSVFDHIVTASGQHMVELVAQNANGTARDTVHYITISPVTVQDPPANTLDGANYINDSTVVLQLHAPGKQFVYVLGDFNGFQADSNYYMKRSQNGEKFWITLNLTAGQRYAYQYWIDGMIRVADPYSELVQDPSNDSYIPSSVYPNPHPYHPNASGRTTLIQPGRTPYIWQNTNFQRPPMGNLLIYELLIRDFTTGHSYQELIDTLDYLERLGVNAIELMPNCEFEGNESWGYNPSYHMALDKYYGTPDQFKAFVDSCHGRGIAVIADFVFNHAFHQSPLINMYWDGVNNRPAADNPWFNPSCPHPPYCWGEDFDHTSQATKDFVDRINTFWLQEYQIDGIRFDYTKGFGNSSSGFNTQRQNLLKRMADSIWSVSPGAYVILEHWGDNSEEKILADYGMMLWGNVTHNYRELAMGFASSSNLSYGVYKSRGWTKKRLITYTESHDEERLMYDVLTYGNQSNQYHDVRQLNTALRRSELAAVFSFMIPGPKMFYMFAELGYDVSIDNPCRVCNKPILWGYQQVPERRRLYDVHAALMHLRRDYPQTFNSSTFYYNVTGPVKQVRMFNANMNAVVVGNADVVMKTGTITFPTVETYYEYFTGDTLQVTATQMSMTMAPGEYRIYTNVKLAQPQITLDMPEFAGVTVDLRAYPNPSGGPVVVEGHGLKSGDLLWQLSDMHGRVMGEGTQEIQASWELSLDLSDLPAGMYILDTRTPDGPAQLRLMRH